MKYIKELVKAGAVIQVAQNPFGLHEEILGGVLENEKGFRWVGIYPEHQGNVHQLDFDRVSKYPGLGVVLYNGDFLAGAVVPLGESSLPFETAREELNAWQATHNPEQLAAFLKDA